MARNRCDHRKSKNPRTIRGCDLPQGHICHAANKSHAKQARTPMTQRPDLDKLLRSTADGLSGAAYTDDAQIVRIIATKRRAAPGEATGAHITITEIEGTNAATQSA